MFGRGKHAGWRSTALAVVISLLAFGAVGAASGDLDTTFDDDGQLTTDISGLFSEDVNGMTLQSDGKIVAVGDRWDPENWNNASANFAVVRYNTDGARDTGFSGDGKKTTDFGKRDAALDVIVQSDGKMVVAGETCTTDSVCDLAVARYTAAGELDTTFNGTGKKAVDFGGDNNGSNGGLAIMSNGKIVIAGYMTNSSGNHDFAAYRLNADGSLDTAFDGDGMVSFGFGSGRQDMGMDMIVKDGKPVIVGKTCDANWLHCNFALARLTSSGALDTTFSGDGKQTTNFGASETAVSVARQSDGKLVVVGQKYVSYTSCFLAVARYNSNGSLDTSFNSTGKKAFAIGTVAWAYDVLVQGDGKIVMVGTAQNTESDDFAMARLKSDGGLDTTFSGDGKLTIDFGGGDELGHAIVRQSDGRYMVAGGSYDGTQADFALARVMP